MARPPLNRPPRSKRPPEVLRQVEETMDAYRRVLDAMKKDKAPAEEAEPDPAPDRR